MRALFCHDTYYARSKNGQVCSYGAFPYRLWEERFLPHFDEITVIGREKAPDPGDAECLDVSNGPKVEHVLYPNINAPLERLASGGKVFGQIKEQVAQADAVIIRGPVEFGMMAAKAARQLGKPYAVEMSGCAFDHTWYHGSSIGKLYAPVKYLQARQMVRHADVVIYVTRDFLQKRYPSNGVMASASNVEIEPASPDVLERKIQSLGEKKPHINIGLIGNFGNNLKGLGVAFNALGSLKTQIPDFTFHVLGKGDPYTWKNTIKNNNLKENIKFSGVLPGGDPVLEWLDQLDLYIQPSFHEGLPRALIEAMSRGLPCLASDAGGTAELLEPENIHRRGDTKALAQRLQEIISDKDWQIQQAERNFEIAKRYTSDQLVPVRQKFWTDFSAFCRGRCDLKKAA